MSTLSALPELVGFFSYSREDDEAFKGKLSALRDGIQRELSAQLGRSKRTFRLWQDQEAIAPGTLWESEITRAVEQSVFFIPIVTPRAVNSPYCKFEFQSFLAREQTLGRADLVFPILYIGVPALEDETQWREHPVLSIVGKRQYVDWRPYRHVGVDTPDVLKAIEILCSKIVAALNQSWISPQERRRLEEEEAREREERERRQHEAEAKRRAEEDARRQREEAEAERIAQERERAAAQAAARRRAAEEADRQSEEADARRIAQEREQQAAEVRRRKEDEERRAREAAEARQRAEADRRGREIKAKDRSEHERKFAAAKRADTVAAVDDFLAAYPESHLAVDARLLRATLIERDEAHREAMSSEDPMVLRGFLRRYPEGVPADEVRWRLRCLEWRP